jgi:hypothetical protein
MPKIFISYRRADSAYVTDSIYDHLSRYFGKENVFLDVESIPFGVDFRAYLRDQIAAHDVVLVIIGPDWARLMQERSSQLNDFVRIEIENALAMDKLVIPVQVMHTAMPNFTDLPISIQELQWRNSVEIRRHPDLDYDCNRLAEDIKDYFGYSSSDDQGAIAQPQIPHSIDLLPEPFSWIDIPGTLGKKWTGAPYKIAKYPVTNAKFEEFVVAGAYKDRRWWTDAGWEARTKVNWTEPRFWQDNKWNGDEQPVVGVSWYECVAFCLWLSNLTNESIMLPTESQWQYAAQGDTGRVDPWGGDWDGKNCNNNVDGKGIGKTSSVRQYEGIGDSPFGVVDMAGNIWEWCLTDYKNKTNDMNSITEQRVLRGGSWFSDNTVNFRCDYRSRYLSNTRVNDAGFRLARSK